MLGIFFGAHFNENQKFISTSNKLALILAHSLLTVGFFNSVTKYGSYSKMVTIDFHPQKNDFERESYYMQLKEIIRLQSVCMM